MANPYRHADAMELLLSDDERFLEARFRTVHRTLSWALVGPGFGEHRRVVWHFVRREELTFDVDPHQLLEERLCERDYVQAVGLLTARHLAPFGYAEAAHDGIAATAVVTVGLGNALRAGDPPLPRSPLGTINVLCRASVPLTDAALVEALALVTEARTLALLEYAYPSVMSGAPATGTGTDCIVVACPLAAPFGPPAHAYAGKHTALGAALGQSVLQATRHATDRWLAERAGAETP